VTGLTYGAPDELGRALSLMPEHYPRRRHAGAGWVSELEEVLREIANRQRVLNEPTTVTVCIGPPECYLPRNVQAVIASASTSRVMARSSASATPNLREARNRPDIILGFGLWI